jgi:hypothetical protein
MVSRWRLSVPLGLVVAGLIVAVAVPAASAMSAVRVKQSVLPLPASSLGSAARSLRLQGDSGVVSNKDLLAVELPVTPNRSFGNAPLEPAKLGRVSGYALDYGHGASGGAGVTEVWTSVDRYKTSTDAKKGLAFWRRWDRLGPKLLGGGELSVAVQKEKTAALGSGRFAVLVRYSAANIGPLFGVDEQFTEGRYEADVTVWAGSAAAARKLVPALAKKLDARIKQALAGRLHARPVKLPARPKAGPPPGGPDLAQLALKTTDLSGQATALGQDYVPTLLALSGYQANMHPAGQFKQLVQDISWYPTANEASFNADFEAALFGQDSLDLSSVGDGARGFLANDSTGGSVALFFSSGQLEEFLHFTSATAVQTSQVKSIAQTVANYINAAGLGS